MSNQIQERHIGIDILRVIAMLSVVFLHTIYSFTVRTDFFLRACLDTVLFLSSRLHEQQRLGGGIPFVILLKGFLDSFHSLGMTYIKESKQALTNSWFVKGKLSKLYLRRR